MLGEGGGEPAQRSPLVGAMTTPSMVIHDAPPEVERTGHGSGDGSGSGNGRGSGYGNGFGRGFGKGAGNGCGWGHGSGCGYGEGWRALP